MAYTFLTKEFCIDRVMGHAGKCHMLKWIYICAVGYVINTKKMTIRDVKVKKKKNPPKRIKMEHTSSNKSETVAS